MSSLVLDNIYPLKSAARYSSPRRASDVLPELFGDLTENSGDNPITPCVCLDTSTQTYAISGRPVLSEADGNTFRFWAEDGTELTSSQFTVHSSIDYQGQGAIALVICNANYGEVSAQCMGAVNNDGALLTNPLDIFQAILGESAVIHRTSFLRARTAAADAGYVAAGAITSQHQYRTWLTNVATSFLIDWYIGQDDQIKFRIDTTRPTGLQPAFFLVERETTRVEAFQRGSDILNSAPAYYAASYAKRDRRFREGVNLNYLQFDDGMESQDLNSLRRYGLRNTFSGAAAYEFDWCRNLATVHKIQARLVERFAHPFWAIQWDEFSKQAMAAEIGDIGVYAWHERIDREGTTGTPHYGQLLEKEIPLLDGGLRLYLRDMGLIYDSTVRYWDGTDLTLGEEGGAW